MLSPGKEGLVHISKLAKQRVEKVEDVVSLGDVVKVVCMGKDKMGRVSFSIKDVPAVPHSFLKMQLSRNLSRSVGTAVSMSVGLSLFVGVQTWGYSMLVPFSPDTSTPGTLVSFLHTEFKSADVPDITS